MTRALFSNAGRLTLLLVLVTTPRLPLIAAPDDDNAVVQNRRAALAERLPDNLGRGLRELAADYEDLATSKSSDDQRVDAAVKSSRLVQRDQRHRILVDIYPDGNRTITEIRRRVEKMGGEVTSEVDWYRHGLLSAWIPLRKAKILAATNGVSAVQLAPRRQNRIGKTTSQGAVVHHTDTVNATGYKGSGVSIGVLSDSYNKDTADASDPGFTTAAQDVTSGDLPGSTNPNGYTTAIYAIDAAASSSNTDEGRAMLQIIHDLAPAATLSFATSGNTVASFAANITTLQSTKSCKVMCDDIAFYSEPFFSDGVVAQAVDQVTAKGVVYFSAAGNDGNSGYAADYVPVDNTTGTAQATVEGVNVSGITTAEKNAIYQWHSFGTDSNGKPIVVQTVTTGTAATTLVLQWDDPFDVTNGVTTDFDILVFSSSGTYSSGRSGKDTNSSTKEPIEIPGTDLAANTTYKICIVQTNRIAAATRKAGHLRYLGLTNAEPLTGDYITTSSITSYGHCCAAGAIGVAAYDYDIAPALASHTFKPGVEDFSSNGPVKIYFDAAGNRLASAILRKQPTIAAVDGVNTTFFPPDPTTPNPNDTEGDGFPNFFGTSAATPHAAAIAALLINAATVNGLGTLSPADIRSILINSAQKTTDQDLYVSTGTAGPVTITARGDSSAASTTNFFTVAFNGVSGQQLTKLVINLSPVGLHFDPNATTGFPFTIGSTTGSPAPAFSGTPALSGGSSGASVATINFSNFNSGSTLAFGVDRDEDSSNASGNGADELGGLTTAGGATFTATVSGNTYTGTFFNKLSGTYNFKAGYGLIDAAAAVNYLLGL